MHWLAVSLLLALPAAAATQHTIEARVVLRDYSHPKHAGDFHEETLQLTMAADSEREAIAFTFRGAEGEPDRFLLRGQELFTIEGAELKPAEGAGDLRASTLVKLDPLFVLALLESYPQNRNGSFFSHAGQLWNVRGLVSGTPDSIETRVMHDLYGQLVETVRYENWSDRGGFRFPARITVTEGTRTKAQLEVTSVRTGMEDEHVRASRANPRSVYDEDISFREIAPHLYAVELKPTNSRVFVAEFADHLFVIEAAYNDRNVSRIARRIRQRFPSKPVRHFSFSHIHGQYVGGVETYLAAGAKVVTTPTGAEVVKEITRQGTIDVVAKSRTFEDAANAMTVYNVDSQHTDDYFVFYFPRSKLLLAGDLLCYRGKDTPLRGRSKHLCKTIETLGIDVEQIQITWPLEGYGCISPVAVGDFKQACDVPDKPR